MKCILGEDRKVMLYIMTLRGLPTFYCTFGNGPCLANFFELSGYMHLVYGFFLALILVMVNFSLGAFIAVFRIGFFLNFWYIL